MPHLMLQTCWPPVPAADVFEHLWPVCTQTVPGERRGRGCRATWQSPSRISPGPFKSHRVISSFSFMMFHLKRQHSLIISSAESDSRVEEVTGHAVYAMTSSFHRPTLPLGQVNTFHTVMIILQTNTDINPWMQNPAAFFVHALTMIH